MKILAEAATRIINEMKAAIRAVFVITSRPPGMI
jgi:GMP synthase PP-ATPase subunit